MSDNKKPPIGLIPRFIHDGNRVLSIIHAIERYIKAEKPVPTEWIDELKSICVEHQNE